MGAGVRTFSLCAVSAATLWAVTFLTRSSASRVGVNVGSSTVVCKAVFSIEAIATSRHADMWSMEELAAYVERDAVISALTRRLYTIERGVAHSRVPADMRRALEGKGRSPPEFETQTIVVVASQVLPAESLAFNRVRSLRFGGRAATISTSTIDGRFAAELSRLPCHLPTASDFCWPRNRTMADAKLGYLETAEAVAFANMVSLVALCARWFAAAYEARPTEGQFPTLTFDLLSSGGASQTHPHMQPHLSQRRYPGVWEAVRQAACVYGARHGRSFFQDMASLHALLGLQVKRTAHFVGFVALTSAGSGLQLDILGDASVTSSEAAAAEALAVELGGIMHDLYPFQWIEPFRLACTSFLSSIPWPHAARSPTHAHACAGYTRHTWHSSGKESQPRAHSRQWTGLSRLGADCLGRAVSSREGAMPTLSPTSRCAAGVLPAALIPGRYSRSTTSVS